jgi:hypothetical protein
MALQSVLAELKSVKNAATEIESMKKAVHRKAENSEVQR